MITARMTAGRRIAASLALAGLALGVTGCGAINQQETTTNYAPSDGIVADVADAKVRNLLLVTNAEHQEARLIGSVVNNSDSSLTLSVKAGNASAVKIPVDASGTVKLESKEFVVDGLNVAPGEHAEATLSTEGESVETSIPVVDGTLKEYREFVPGGFEQSTTDHLTPSEQPEHGGSH
ncbi:hypothetical protein [Glutamicibacter creatinolyticus]|uniref:hypothetical protein n=1 Tax=Glutamicibacter creatinolyticus TaxID=162496 RepID=UPI0037BFEA97